MPKVGWLSFALSVLLSCGCSGKPAGSRESGGKAYPFRGTVLTVNPERGDILVRHEDIPGLMKAMTMRFPVDGGADALKNLAPGEQITATLRVSGQGFHLENIAVVKEEANPAPH